MPEKARTFCKAALAVGIILALYHTSLLLIESEGATEEHSVIVPNVFEHSEHTAEIVYYFGGGAIAPYCFSSILVYGHDKRPSNTLERKQFSVFSGSCDNFSNYEKSPTAEWVSATALKISVATAPEETTFRLRSTDNSGEVSITLLAHP